MATKTRGSNSSSSARHRAKGRRPIQLWVSPAEYAELRKRADKERRPITQYILSKVLA